MSDPVAIKHSLPQSSRHAPPPKERPTRAAVTLRLLLPTQGTPAALGALRRKPLRESFVLKESLTLRPGAASVAKGRTRVVRLPIRRMEVPVHPAKDRKPSDCPPARSLPDRIVAGWSRR